MRSYMISALRRNAPVIAIIAAVFATSCRSAGRAEDNTVNFWGLGREGEVVQSLVPEFERRNPGLHVRVQQIPWTAAHEKLLTAVVGDATPDVAQLGNTWVPEFAALGTLAPLEGLIASSSTVVPAAYFHGIWETNVVDGHPYGIPWYVDTRVMFYRRDLLRRAGISEVPTNWGQWRDALRRVKALGPPTEFGVLMPLDEWTQPVIFGLQMGAPLLSGGGRWGDFRDPRFRDAFQFYVDLFKSGLAPAVANSQISNVYQEFARGRFAFYITGPWNIGEFRRRLPPGTQDEWSTAPLPGPTGSASGVSIAGGASLVVFSASPHKAAAWRFIEFLSEPAQQVRFYTLTGDLPARTESCRAPVLANDVVAHAFAEQLTRAVPLPKVPEWEQIAQEVAQYAEQAARGRMSVDVALTRLDGDVNEILAKRRWVLDRLQHTHSGVAMHTGS
ncbi:MAG: sugar ABC transporter substrate-binding protein [Gemmatimonadaceae bacterium]